ncbi:MAG: membrane protein insertion efficiency factor YidD [Candidatus Omnitrophota bacterium]
MTWMLVVVLKIYQNILSPFLPESCRYYPSCSEYAKEALTRYGSKKGTLLTLRRLSRCHPFCAGGYDPIR